MMNLRFGAWVAEGPSQEDVALEIDATTEILRQFAYLKETI
jgi:hypothetical protein